jgi:hypothetical protein
MFRIQIRILLVSGSGFRIRNAAVKLPVLASATILTGPLHYFYLLFGPLILSNIIAEKYIIGNFVLWIRIWISVADPGCLSWILIFTHSGSQIPDPGSLSKKQQPKRGVKKISCQTFFCSHKFHKIENYFIFKYLRKIFGPVFKEL